MKKLTLLAVLALGAVTMNAQVVLTGNDSAPIDGGVFCGAGNFADLTAYRSFVLTDEGVDGDLQINTIQYGAGTGSVAGAPPEGITATINVYTTDAPFPTGTLTPIATATDVLFDGDGGVTRDVAIDALIPAGSEVVISYSFPNDGQTNVSLGSGGTNDGNVSWIQSIDCLGDDTISDLNDFGLSNAWVLNAIGEEVILGLDDNLADVASIFPNPATDVLNVSIPSNVEVKSAVLFDVLGKDTGLRLSNGTINTSNLARGVYILNIQTDRGNLTEKIVKQ